MTKIFIAIAAVIIVLGGALYYIGRSAPKSTLGSSQALQQQQMATTTYTGSTFTISYPTDFTVDPAFSNEEVSVKKPISGVRFTIPEATATGTNLGADTFLSVEWLPRAKQCTGDIYLQQNVKSQDFTDGGIVYSMASTTGAAAGNRYEEEVFAIPNSSPCTAVRYFIHYSDISNYPAGAVQEFDSTKLMSTFDTMRRSLMLTAATPATTQP